MVFSDALTKAGRLVELQLLFWRNAGRVLTTSRIAERLGVAPRTVRKYLIEMSGSGRLPICRDGRGWRAAVKEPSGYAWAWDRRSRAAPSVWRSRRRRGSCRRSSRNSWPTPG